MSAIKSRVIIGSCSLAILILSLVLDGELIPMLLMLLFALIALIVLYRALPNLCNVSEDNPKTKTLRNVTIFSICVLVIDIPFCILWDKGIIQLTPYQETLFVPILIATSLARDNMENDIPAADLTDI